MPKIISQKQQRLFFSKDSPLDPEQKAKLQEELRAGVVKIENRKRKKKY